VEKQVKFKKLAEDLAWDRENWLNPPEGYSLKKEYQEYERNIAKLALKQNNSRLYVALQSLNNRFHEGESWEMMIDIIWLAGHGFGNRTMREVLFFFKLLQLLHLPRNIIRRLRQC
jgi:hypothetical protein